jgi:type II secretory pathway component GspD/PulD (secretin)
MNIKLTALLIGLATSGLACYAQENNPAPPPPTPPVENVAPETPAPTQTPAVTPAPEQAPAPTPTPAPAPTTPPVNGTELRVQAAEPVAQNNAATPAAGQAQAAPVNPDEVVPLIVIDDVPLTDAIRNLARQSGLNFQFDPRVTSSNQPNVSIRFENVTAQEALHAVLENYNLALIKEPKAKIARVTIKDPKAEDPLVTRIIQLRYADPTNLISIVKSTLSPRSSVVADPRTSQLIVNTTEKELDGFNTLIAKLDTPTKQVLIEAKLLETSKNPKTIKGIDWSGTLEAQKFQFGNNLQSAPTDAGLSDNKVLAGQFPKLLVDTAKGFNPATAFLDADGVSAVLSFLNTDTDTEVVATPRAVTLDNQTATLSVTKAFPIFQVTPGSANSPAGATVTYTNLGAILHVTPRIAADKNISLRVVPEVSNIDSVDTQTLNNTVNTANIYAIRRIETAVMIPSGNTLVMGGLVNDTKTKSYVKVPVLGDLPFIGLAFRKESKERNKQNLIIFITPTIVEDGDFHASATGRLFMQSKGVESPEEKETAWDSAKPYDWTKQPR